MPVELPDDAVRIRNLYPIMKCDRGTWKRILALTREGGQANVEAAESLAKTCTEKHPRTRALHAGALRKRGLRRQFLAAQKRGEAPIKAALAALADRVDTIVNREARDGVLPPARYQAAAAAIAERNKEAYAEIARLFMAELRRSVHTGLRHAMSTAQRVQQVAVDRLAREEDAPVDEEPALQVDYLDENAAEVVHLLEAGDPLKQKLVYATRSGVFQKLFTGSLRKTMEAGLLGKTGVSARVWDLRDQNLTSLKRKLAAGIAAGDDPATISRDVRGLLVQPKTLRGAARAAARPGPGVYIPAYANAMRLTRTESNRAYVMSDGLFAEDKGWNLIWMVSTGQREEDECDDYGGNEYAPEEFAKLYPVHPNDLCYTIAAPVSQALGGSL